MSDWGVRGRWESGVREWMRELDDRVGYETGVWEEGES